MLLVVKSGFKRIGLVFFSFQDGVDFLDFFGYSFAISGELEVSCVWFLAF